MNTIEKIKLQNVRYLCGTPEIAKNRYENIKQTLKDPDLYNIFAEPIYIAETKTIIWGTNINGTPVKYTKLTDADKSLANRLLRQKINKILNIVKQYNDQQLLEFFLNCIEIPSMDSVYLIKQPSENYVILTQWGFVSDQPGNLRGILAKIIEVKKVDLKIKTVYEDNHQPAANTEIIFSYEDKTQKYSSDNNGIIIIPEIPIDIEFIIETTEQPTKKYKFFSYENAEYTIEVPRKVNVKFKVIDENNNPLQGIKLIFEYEGQKQTLISDVNGQIILNNLKPKTEIQVIYQTEEEIKNFGTYQAEETEYLIKIEKPKYKMPIKIVDKQGNPIANAKVKVKFNGKKQIYYSDQNGFIYIENIEPGTKVKVIAKAKAQKNNKK